MGTKVQVFQDRLVWKTLFGLGGETSIPLSQIASVDVGMPGLQQVIVETTGGKRCKMVVRLSDKQKFRDAIYNAKSR